MEVSESYFWYTESLQPSSSNINETGNLFMYFTQGVSATEVEVDTLTGDHTVLRVDIHVHTYTFSA
jgi:xanthine dehydrogenase molybdopterin-binding subunit B